MRTTDDARVDEPGIWRTELGGVPRMTVAAFAEACASGLWPESAAVELLDGIPVIRDRRDDGGSITSEGVRHVRVRHEVRRGLERVLDPFDVEVIDQTTVELSEWLGPIPDVAVLSISMRTLDEENRFPRADELVLVVEIGLSSLGEDLGERRERYAHAWIARYWAVDAAAGELVVHRGPRADGRYAEVLRIDRSGTADIEIDTDTTVSVPVDAVVSAAKTGS